MALHKQKADQRLKRKGELTSDALRSMDQAVIATDKEGLITLMNPAAESWTGWRLAQARHTQIDQVMQLKGHRRTSVYVLRAVRTEAIEEFDEGCMLVRRAGDSRPIVGSISPIRDHSGQISGATIVFGGTKGERTAAAPVAAIAKSEPGGFQMVAESVVMQRL